MYGKGNGKMNMSMSDLKKMRSPKAPSMMPSAPMKATVPMATPVGSSSGMAGAGKSGNWIAKATSKNKGAFGRQAKRAGMSTAAYASKVTKSGSKASATTKKRGQLAKTLMSMHK